jgi:preprotein translocase subunit SecG
MLTVLLVIHLMIAAALVGVVLMQRSEGGALGIGGGGGFMTGRGAANFMTRVTAGLAAAFFATSIFLTLLATRPAPERSILDTAAPASDAGPQTAPQTAPQSGSPEGGTLGTQNTPPGRGGVLDKLAPQTQGPRLPQSQ